jgi:hypothetical protein
MNISASFTQNLHATTPVYITSQLDTIIMANKRKKTRSLEELFTDPE